MEALARLDQALIDAAEKGLFAGRTKLGLSFPRAVSICASMTVVVLAFSVFLSSGDLLAVKIPLLALYAVLAITMGKTLFRHLAYFDASWSYEIERGFAKSAMENRVKLRPARAILWAFAVMSVLFTSTFSLRLLELDAISPLNAGRDILSSLLGISRSAHLSVHYVRATIRQGHALDPGFGGGGHELPISACEPRHASASQPRNIAPVYTCRPLPSPLQMA